MKVNILVVEHEGELLFQLGDLLFDELQAYYEFAEGTLSVFRNGELFDQTSAIYEVGTHASYMAFIGLYKVFSSARGHGEIAAARLQAGDEIVVEFRAPQNFDLGRHIRVMAGILGSVHGAFDEQQEWGVRDLQQRISEDLAQREQELKTVKVVRFRSQQ
ncbi:MAG TPA: hypothetical protein VEA59_03910 [Patescibacteria group bacterium]|nr:hypothetical protein [Patescibacteria group bacterium]